MKANFHIVKVQFAVAVFSRVGNVQKLLIAAVDTAGVEGESLGHVGFLSSLLKSRLYLSPDFRVLCHQVLDQGAQVSQGIHFAQALAVLFASGHQLFLESLHGGRVLDDLVCAVHLGVLVCVSGVSIRQNTNTPQDLFYNPTLWSTIDRCNLTRARSLRYNRGRLLD